MSNKNKILVFLAFFVALLFPSSAMAATGGLGVQPVAPATQRKTSESYFDVVVAPGKSTELKVKLTNTSTKDIQANVAIKPAETSDNGMVSYAGQPKRDVTLQNDISDYVKFAKKVTIPAKKSVKYVAVLKMPETKLPGMMAGGIIISPIKHATKASSGKLSIINNYNYNIALIARNVNKTWSPKLRVRKAQVRQDNHQNTIAVPLHNYSPTYLNRLSVTTKAKNLDTGKTYQRTTSGMQMAPNSHFFYRLNFADKVPAGKYQVVTQSDYVRDAKGKYKNAKGTHFKYEVKKTSTLRVTKQKSRDLQKQINQSKGGTPWFVYAIVGLIVALILAVITLAVMLYRRGKHIN